MPTIAPILTLLLPKGMHKPYQYPSTPTQPLHISLSRHLTMVTLLMLLPIALVHAQTILTCVSAELRTLY